MNKTEFNILIWVSVILANVQMFCLDSIFRYFGFIIWVVIMIVGVQSKKSNNSGGKDED